MKRCVRENSLSLFFLAIFLASWFAQSVTGMTACNQEQHDHGDPRLSWLGHIGSSQFWESTFQNWQSEFLAVYLRQRGSPESKPVGAPLEDATGEEG